MLREAQPESAADELWTVELELRRLADDVARLAGVGLPDVDFCAEFLGRVIEGLDAAGGCVWVREGETLKATAATGDHADGQPAIDAWHVDLLQQVAESGVPLAVRREADFGSGSEPNTAADGDDLDADDADSRSRTERTTIERTAGELLLLAPVVVDGAVVAVVEVEQQPGAGEATQQGYLRFMAEMCGLAAEHWRRSDGDRLKKGTGTSRTTNSAEESTSRLGASPLFQPGTSPSTAVADESSERLGASPLFQPAWEAFAEAVHNSIDLKRTAASIVNEARRLLGCDRASLAVCQGRRARVAAVSGQDVFDKRSDVVQSLGRLATRVAAVGEPLWRLGDQADDLPPQLDEILHAHLDLAHATALVAMPLAPQKSDSDSVPPQPLGVLVVEYFNAAPAEAPLREDLATVCRHATPALSNALDHERIFLLPLWRALGKARGLVQGRTRWKTAAVAVVLTAVVAALVFVPADFELEGQGTLVPVVRREVFAPLDGEIRAVPVRHGDRVEAGQVLMELRNVDLEVQWATLRGELSTTQEKLSTIELALLGGNRLSDVDRERLHGERLEARQELTSLDRRLALVEEKRKLLAVRSPIAGEVVTWDVERLLLNRPVQRGEALLSVVDPQGEWELEVRMPERTMGHVRRAQHELGDALGVEYILATDPGRTLRGTVKEVHQQAQVRGDAGNTVLVKVALTPADIGEPRPGAEASARLRCGRRALGYVWLHDVAAFIQSRVLFRL